MATQSETPAQAKRPERSIQLVMDLGERLMFVMLFAAFAVAFIATMDRQPYNLVVLASETVLCAFILFRPWNGEMSMRPFDWLAAIIGTMAPMLVRPGGEALAPDWLSASLMTAGAAFAFWAQLTLRTRFGIAAANRGVAAAGPYRLVRHPMYAGYLVTHVGILLANPRIENLLIYVVATSFQLIRINAEERLLTQDPAYLIMRDRVRFRLIPGVY